MADRRDAPAHSPARMELERSLAEDAEPLMDSIRVYVRQFGLARGDDVQALARDIFQDVAVEAIEHSDRFTEGRRPLPWLLGIALNVIKRRKVADAKRARRELASSDIAPLPADSQTEVTTFERTADRLAAEQFARIEDDAEAEALLTLVPEADRDVLRLAVVEGWSGEALARKLGTSAVAARVRLHRALARLRVAWFARETQGQRKGASNG